MCRVRWWLRNTSRSQGGGPVRCSVAVVGAPDGAALRRGGVEAGGRGDGGNESKYLPIWDLETVFFIVTRNF